MNDYLQLIEHLLAQQKTTGTNHSEAMLHYTRLNLQRMQRWLKTAEITSETKQVITTITTIQHWVVLTEAWCGDAAHSMGIIYKMTELNPLIRFEWKLRDENLDLMDQYLTNGGRSIPKLIVYNQTGHVLFHWGPRPAAIQQEFLKMKAANTGYEEISMTLQKLYNAAKGYTIQSEICALIQETTKNH